jgi:hypothetical protein
MDSECGLNLTGHLRSGYRDITFQRSAHLRLGKKKRHPWQHRATDVATEIVTRQGQAASPSADLSSNLSEG